MRDGKGHGKSIHHKSHKLLHMADEKKKVQRVSAMLCKLLAAHPSGHSCPLRWPPCARGRPLYHPPLDHLPHGQTMESSQTLRISNGISLKVSGLLMRDVHML